LAGGAPGGHLEQPAGRHAGQEVQGSDDGRYPDLEEHPGPGRGHKTEGTARKADSRRKGQRCVQAAQGAPTKGKATKKATAAKNAPKGK